MATVLPLNLPTNSAHKTGKRLASVNERPARLDLQFYIIMRYLLLVLLFMSGCVSQTVIDEQIARCPQFVQDNVGEIIYMPVSWGTAMGICGVTDKHTGEIWLTAWADEHTILHEIAHSVYFRVPNEEFTKEFRKQDGFVSIWSMGIYEEVAEAFYEGMQGRSNPKIDCAMKFFNGEFGG